MTSGIKAIITHTDEDIIKDVRETLIKSNIYVDVEPNPESIEHRLSNGESRKYDILILGDILGNRDGISITKNIRNANCNIPVVFISKNRDYIERINAIGLFVHFVHYPEDLSSIGLTIRNAINDSKLFVEMGHVKKMLESMPSTIEASVSNVVEDVFRGKFQSICNVNSGIVKDAIISEVEIMTTPRNLATKLWNDRIFKGLISLLSTIIMFSGYLVWQNRESNIKTDKQVENIKGQLNYISKSVDSMDRKIEAAFKAGKIKLQKGN